MLTTKQERMIQSFSDEQIKKILFELLEDNSKKDELIEGYKQTIYIAIVAQLTTILFLIFS